MSVDLSPLKFEFQECLLFANTIEKVSPSFICGLQKTARRYNLRSRLRAHPIVVLKINGRRSGTLKHFATETHVIKV